MASAPFDRSAVLANFCDDEHLLHQVASACVADWAENVTSLQAAGAARDAVALRTAAHRVKGAFANFAADRAVAAARRLESACADGLPANYEQLLDETVRLGNELVDALRREARS